MLCVVQAQGHPRAKLSTSKVYQNVPFFQGAAWFVILFEHWSWRIQQCDGDPGLTIGHLASRQCRSLPGFSHLLVLALYDGAFQFRIKTIDMSYSARQYKNLVPGRKSFLNSSSLPSSPLNVT